MSQYYLLQDAKRCIGCLACEVACKSNKRLPLGPALCKNITVGPRMIRNIPEVRFVFMPCFHCEKPWCVTACPTGAMQKRTKDGIVFVDQSICIGCKACIAACPWGAPQWDPEIGRATKCDYCRDRLDLGLKPACVTKCVTQCLQFGPARELTQSRREQFAGRIAFDHEKMPPGLG
jgi:DMSO reductase iron-sulfur subunit